MDDSPDDDKTAAPPARTAHRVISLSSDSGSEPEAKKEERDTEKKDEGSSEKVRPRVVPESSVRSKLARFSYSRSPPTTASTGDRGRTEEGKGEQLVRTAMKMVSEKCYTAIMYLNNRM